jgi:hypothetical protein
MTAPGNPEPIDTGELQNSLNELASVAQNVVTRLQESNMAETLDAMMNNMVQSMNAVPDMFSVKSGEIKSSLNQLTSSLQFTEQLSALVELRDRISAISADIGAGNVGEGMRARIAEVEQSLSGVQQIFNQGAANIQLTLAEVNRQYAATASELSTVRQKLAEANAAGNFEQTESLITQISALEEYQSALAEARKNLQNMPIVSELAEQLGEVATGATQLREKLAAAVPEAAAVEAMSSESPSALDAAVSQLVTAIKKAVSDIAGSDTGNLQTQISGLVGKLLVLPTELSAQADPLKADLLSLGDNITKTTMAMQTAQAQANMLSAIGDVEGAKAQVEQYANLATTAEGLVGKLADLRGQVAAVVDPIQQQRKATAELTKQMNMSLTDMIADKIMGGEGAGGPLKLLFSKITAVFSEINKIAMEGLKRATDLGLSAAEGAKLEFTNRATEFASIFTLDASKMVTPEQINSMQSAAMSTFVNMAEGMQLSSMGAKKLQQDLQSGFGSEFTLTGESLRALAITGATSVDDFESFRQATGRAALSGNQMATLVNKNSLSFLLFGNAIAGAAAKFERLGISLAAIQKGQESFVTNLDGGIDTIAQLNQLGATLDFGTLAQLSEFGTPDQVADYIRSAVPTSMLNSASVRSLFGQLMPGMDAETLLKMVKTGKSLDEFEGRLSENATGTGAASEALAAMAKGGNILSGTFLGMIGTIIAAILALKAFASTAAQAALINGGASKVMLGATKILGGLALGGVGLGIGLAGMSQGREMIRQGDTTGGALTTIGSAVTAGAIIGSVIPGVGTAVGALTGAGLGLIVGIIGAATANDATWDGTMMSKYPAGELQNAIPAGFGNKVLLDTRTGETTAFNNKDKFMFAAGTELGLANDMILNETATKFPEGELGKGDAESSGKASAEVQRLIAKMDAVITSIQNANTTIRIDGGQPQQVSRFQVVGVDLTRGGATVA